MAPEDVVARALPPDEAAYHFTFPALVVADRSTVPTPALVPSVDPVMVGCEFTVAVTAVLAAEVHVPSSASA